MKILLVFYSRTGTTKKIAVQLGEMLKAEREEIIDLKDRRGLWGLFNAGRDAIQRVPTKIRQPEKNPSAYDLVVIGTPVWASRLPPATLAYLAQNMAYFKKVAFFCTAGTGDGSKAFAEMSRLCGKKPLAAVALTSNEARTGIGLYKLNKFIDEIQL